MKKKLRLLLLAVFTMLFVGSMTVSASGFSISHNKVTMNVGDTLDLDASGTDKTPVWTSYNVNKVTVNQDGVMTAVRSGKTTVSARVGLTRKKCTVTVVSPSVKLDKKTATLYTGGTSAKTVQLKPTVKGAKKTVVWESSNPTVAKVNSKGKISSVSAGKATITATANGKTASCVVTVKESAVSLNMENMLLSTKGTGSAMKLKPTVVGSKKTVTWTSSNSKVATVDSEGKVTGKKSGTAVITAKANGVSATCNVTVEGGLISIDAEKTVLYTGETKQLKTNAGKNDVLTWKSSDETVATVENGKVTAVGAGTAMISVESDGTADTCEVTVKDTVTSIGEEVVELKTKGSDKTYTLGYKVVGRSSTIKWTTSDSTVVTVKDGKVTAKKAGTATITATANGLSDSVQVTVYNYDPTIKLNQKAYTLYTKKGNTLTLTPTVNGVSQKVSWKSSDTGVAKVNSKGKVTALKEGQTMITATANGVTAECLITVVESKVILEKETICMEKGAKASLPADVVGASQTLAYKSSNSKIVTVKNGVLTAKKYGEAKIRVSANGVTAVCLVKVDKCVHNFDEGSVTQTPTCVADGIKTFTCTKCGYAYTETIKKGSHRWEETNRQEATCINSGIVTYTCSDCTQTKQEMVASTGHLYGDWIVVTEATDISLGLEKQQCTVCDALNYRVIEKTGHEHTYAEVVTEPTCTEQGYTTYNCGCGEFYVDSHVDALGHDFSDWVVTKEPTDTEDGEKTRSCSRCGETENEPVLKGEHVHSYAEEVTAPTCTEKGYTTHTCGCGDSFKDTYTDPLGHAWGEWTTTKEATEEEEGEETRSCSRCSETETQPVAKLVHEHSYTEEVTAPTCTEKGYTSHTCRCGETYKDTYVDALGHDWGEWTTTKEATEEEEGE